MSKVVQLKNAGASEAIRQTLNDSTVFVMDDVTKPKIMRERKENDILYLHESKHPDFIRIVKPVHRFASTICNLRLDFKHPVEGLIVKLIANHEIPCSLMKISNFQYKIQGLDENKQFFFMNSIWQDLEIEMLIPKAYPTNKDFIAALNLPANTEGKIINIPNTKLVQLVATWGYFTHDISKRIQIPDTDGETVKNPPMDRYLINPSNYI